MWYGTTNVEMVDNKIEIRKKSTQAAAFLSTDNGCEKRSLAL
jgi:hypothetical protein